MYTEEERQELLTQLTAIDNALDIIFEVVAEQIESSTNKMIDIDPTIDEGDREMLQMLKADVIGGLKELANNLNSQQ